MTRKFGISMDDELATRIEEPLEFGDSRSDRVEELVALGLAVEEAADSHRIDLPESQREREALLRQVFIDAEL